MTWARVIATVSLARAAASGFVTLTEIETGAGAGAAGAGAVGPVHPCAAEVHPIATTTVGTNSTRIAFILWLGLRIQRGAPARSWAPGGGPPRRRRRRPTRR